MQGRHLVEDGGIIGTTLEDRRDWIDRRTEAIRKSHQLDGRGFALLAAREA
jgi:hypothetical protein